MDRIYVKHQNKTQVNQLGLDLWRDVVVRNKRIRERLRSTLLGLVHRERTGEVIDRALMRNITTVRGSTWRAAPHAIERLTALPCAWHLRLQCAVSRPQLLDATNASSLIIPSRHGSVPCNHATRSKIVGFVAACTRLISELTTELRC